MRTNPYSPDEQRVLEHLRKYGINTAEIDDDPIGTLLNAWQVEDPADQRYPMPIRIEQGDDYERMDVTNRLEHALGCLDERSPWYDPCVFRDVHEDGSLGTGIQVCDIIAEAIREIRRLRAGEPAQPSAVVALVRNLKALPQAD